MWSVLLQKSPPTVEIRPLLEKMQHKNVSYIGTLIAISIMILSTQSHKRRVEEVCSALSSPLRTDGPNDDNSITCSTFQILVLKLPNNFFSNNNLSRSNLLLKSLLFLLMFLVCSKSLIHSCNNVPSKAVL